MPDSAATARLTRGAATRERLLTEAARLFAEVGFDGTSVEAISTAAGITVPGMYRHFKNKADVLIAVAQRATLTSAARRSLSTSTDLPGALAALFGEYLAPGEFQRRRLSIELSRAAFGNEDLRRALVEYNAGLRAALSDTIASSVHAAGSGLDHTEIDRLAHLLLVIMMGAVHIDTLDADLIGDRRLVGHLRTTFARLLAHRPVSVSVSDRDVPSPAHGSLSAADAATPPPPSDGRLRRSVETHQRILDAAAELFALRGYDGTTIDAIARQAGITVPGLYRHVTGKEALLVEVGQRAFGAFRLSHPFDHDDAVDRLAALTVTFSASHQQVSRRLAIELDFGAWRNVELADALAGYHRRVRHNVAAAIGGPTPHDTDELAAMVVLMLFMGIAHLDTLDPGLIDDAGWSDLIRTRLPQLVG